MKKTYTTLIALYGVLAVGCAEKPAVGVVSGRKIVAARTEVLPLAKVAQTPVCTGGRVPVGSVCLRQVPEEHFLTIDTAAGRKEVSVSREDYERCQEGNQFDGQHCH